MTAALRPTEDQYANGHVGNPLIQDESHEQDDQAILPMGLPRVRAEEALRIRYAALHQPRRAHNPQFT